MKIMGQHFDAFGWIYSPIFVFIGAMYVMDGYHFMHGLVFCWLFIPLLLFRLWQQQRASLPIYQTQRHPARWMVELALFQCALIGLFQGFAGQLGYTLHLPVIVTFAVFTVFFSTITRVKDTGLLSATLDKLFNSQDHESVMIMSDAYARGMSIIAFAFTLFLLVLLAFNTLQIRWNMPLTFGSNLTNVSFFLAVAWMCVSIHYRKTLRVLDTYLPLTVIAFFVSCALIIAYFAIHFTAHHLPQVHSIQIDHCRNWSEYDYSALMSDMFNFSWILIYTGYLVQLSQGYHVRTVMLVSMIIPTLLTIIPLPHTPWFTIICATYLLILLLQKKQATHIMRATLPNKHTIKIRKTNLFIGSIMAYTSMLFAIYCLTNVFFVSFVATVFVTPVMLLVVVAAMTHRY